MNLIETSITNSYERDGMPFRIATLNLEQDHKRWEARRELVTKQFGKLRPDLWGLNEIHIPSQTGRWLQRAALQETGIRYALVQQSKVGQDGRAQGEGLLSRYPVVETANLDYHSHDCVALVARVEIDSWLLDVYVTHLIAAKVDDTARQVQVARLLEWIRQRDYTKYSVVCGDFNAAPDQPSIRLMAAAFRATQSKPTAFTPLREPNGQPTHPAWQRFDRCIDYIWVSPSIKVRATGLCFNEPAKDDPNLWPSDHVGVWADLELA